MPPKKDRNVAWSKKPFKIEQANAHERRRALLEIDQGVFIQHVVYSDDARTQVQGLQVTRVHEVSPPPVDAPGAFVRGVFVGAQDDGYAAWARNALDGFRTYHICCCKASDCCAKSNRVADKKQGMIHVSEWHLLTVEDVEALPWAAAAVAGEAGKLAKLPPGHLPLASIGGPVHRVKDVGTKVKVENLKGGTGQGRGRPRLQKISVKAEFVVKTEPGAPQAPKTEQLRGMKRMFGPEYEDEELLTEEGEADRTKERILDLSVKAAEQAAKLVGVELRSRGCDAEETATMMAVFVDKYTTGLMHSRKRQALKKQIENAKVEVRAKVKNEHCRKKFEAKERIKCSVVKQEEYTPIQRVILKPKHDEGDTSPTFDGTWVVNADMGHVAEISGDKCQWFDGESYDFTRTGSLSCSLVFKGETLGGILSEDGKSVAWDDDGEWTREVKIKRRFAGKTSADSAIAYRCGMCSDVFKLYTAAYRHRQTVHRVNVHWRICEVCDRQFLNNLLFKEHQLKVHGIKDPKLKDFRAANMRHDRRSGVVDFDLAQPVGCENMAAD